MKRAIKKVIEKSGYVLHKAGEDTGLEAIYGEFGNFTMISRSLYAENLRVARMYANEIEGDVVECGVWRGGMSAGLARVLGDKRKYYLFDSFEGLPAAKDIDGADAKQWQGDTKSETYYDNCKAEIGFAETAMQKAGVSFELIKGWFSETLSKFTADNAIALLRLDGDWYESTMDCLTNLYPKVASKGVIIIDDYFTWEGCSKAVHDYLSSIKSSSRIHTSAGGVCYIIKNDHPKEKPA
ncbi:MAG TPA: TylF/MycF/NovP-related O-methyltransferase [Puia sp.]|jgi:O-methyltransferase|nr:TylF/MycF/NovP-related O-methyltransferase [Puia sp.]